MIIRSMSTRVYEDCPSKHACLDNTCKLLCETLNPCTRLATCTLYRSGPWSAPVLTAT